MEGHSGNPFSNSGSRGDSVSGNGARTHYDDKVTPTGPAEIKALAVDFN
jgi:hypothetical protein